MGLRNKAVDGFLWTSMGTIGAGLINFLITIILARILTPGDFGLIELLIVFTTISEVFIDSGFSQAIIRDNKATSEDLSSVFFLNLIIALSLYGILFFVSPFIAIFYNSPQLTSLSRVVFLAIIFNSFSIVQNANFVRKLNFRPYALASIIAMTIAGGTSIILALCNYGVWALVANIVLLAAIRTICLWIQSDWFPVFIIRYASIKRYFSFGSSLLLQGLLDRVVTNMESLIIGKFYQKSELGYFSQARKLDSYVIQTSTTVIQKVTYPILSSIGDSVDKLRMGYRRVIGVTMFCLTPIIMLMLAAADNCILGLLGQNWAPAIPYFRLWIICGWLVAIYSIYMNIFMVVGRNKKMLKITFIRQLMRLLVIFFLARIGIEIMLYGIICVTVISALGYMYAGGKLINYSLKDTFSDMWQIVLGGALASLLVYYFGVVMQGVNHLVTFLFQTGFYIIIYLVLMRLLHNIYYREIIDIISFIYKKVLNKK